MKRVALLFSVSIIFSMHGMHEIIDEIDQEIAQIEGLRQAGISEEDISSRLSELRKQREQLVELQKSNVSAKQKTDSEFQKQIEQLHTLQKEAQVLAKAGKEDAYLAKEMARSALFQAVQDELIKQSKSKWFFSGDTYWKYLQLKEVPYHKQLPYGNVIPNNLQLKHPFVYLLSFQQIAQTCGYNALANGQALQIQVNEQKQITFEQTRKIAEDFFENVIEKKVDLDTCNNEEIGALLEFANGENCLLVSQVSSADAYTNLFVLMPEYFNEFTDKQKEEIIGACVNNNATHFILRTGEHYTILTVVKDGINFHLYYLNSSNAPTIQENVAPLIYSLDDLLADVSQKVIQERQLPRPEIKQALIKRKKNSEQEQPLISSSQLPVSSSQSEPNIGTLAMGRASGEQPGFFTFIWHILVDLINWLFSVNQGN